LKLRGHIILTKSDTGRLSLFI